MQCKKCNNKDCVCNGCERQDYCGELEINLDWNYPDNCASEFCDQVMANDAPYVTCGNCNCWTEDPNCDYIGYCSKWDTQKDTSDFCEEKQIEARQLLEEHDYDIDDYMEDDDYEI